MVFRRELRAAASECVGLGRKFNQAQDALDCSKAECRSPVLNKRQTNKLLLKMPLLLQVINNIILNLRPILILEWYRY